jgi:hypothetical protein
MAVARRFSERRTKKQAQARSAAAKPERHNRLIGREVGGHDAVRACHSSPQSRAGEGKFGKDRNNHQAVEFRPATTKETFHGESV